MSNNLNDENYYLVKDSLPWFLSNLSENENKLVYIGTSNTEILKLKSICENIFKINCIYLFPEIDSPLFSNIPPTDFNKNLRITSLMNITNFKHPKIVLLTTFKAILTKVLPLKLLNNNYLEIQIGIDVSVVEDFLIKNSYNRVETVRGYGEYAIRGDILDIYSPGNNYPLRIDLFLSKIESIKIFDPITQLSLRKIIKKFIYPSSEIFINEESIENFRTNYRLLNLADDNEYYESISQGIKIQGYEKFLPLFYKDYSCLVSSIKDYKFIINENFKENLSKKFDDIKNDFLNYGNFSEAIFCRYIASPEEIIKGISKDMINYSHVINFNHQKKVKHFSKPINLSYKLNSEKNKNKFLQYVKNNLSLFDFLFTLKSDATKKKLMHILKDFNKNLVDLDKNKKILYEKNNIFFLKIDISNSFEIIKNKNKNILVFTESSLFEKKVFTKSRPNINPENLIEEISNLIENEIIVHSEHGIGRFKGLKNIQLYEAIHECVEIEYYNKDILLLPVENLELISRFGSKDSIVSLDKLGSQNWQLRKALIKKKLKDIAFDLIKVAAERKLKTGQIIIPNNDNYVKFSEKFNYIETSDQLKAINDIENDLSSGVPMDRLICGDVGFGKTEIAMRAAFMVASDGQQVAFLCPTTLLANQHYNNFKNRFEALNISIKKFSRFESLKEKKEISDFLKDNTLKVLIGTHAILSESFIFNKLGLLIIDEEQSFGVEQKEKLKKLKSNVHILTLSATPIPRTLQSSLLGIRDLSMIRTPPVDRLPIKTYVTSYNKTTIKNAIENELQREGQIFYVAPKIKDLNIIYLNLKKIFPNNSLEIAHGKLNGNVLNNVYKRFYEKKIDILISTSIIESGLDVTNVNTIIIEKPNYFGLSQLYQLRGRVGRSSKQAFAYLILPEGQLITNNAVKRIEVISKLDRLGAGFTIASHDLDIRGSGNLIGEEQSGHIKEIGIELYQKLIKDTISEIQNNKNIDDDWSPQINLGFPVFIPESYIKDLQTRLSFYRRISRINSLEKIKEILGELDDRYGTVPNELINLTKVVEIKYLSKLVNVSKITSGSKGFIISFKNNKFSGINNLLELVKKNNKTLKLRPDNKLVYLSRYKESEKKFREIKNFLILMSEIK